MPLATAATVAGPDIIHRPGLILPAIDHLRRVLDQRRQRRVDRVVAETVLMLDHPEVVQDYRVACRGR